MPEELLLFDPALLIWDQNDFTTREHHYWALAADFITLLDILDQSPCRPLVSARLAEIIINEFPADQLSGSGVLRDFTHVVYGFLTRCMTPENEYPANAATNFTPDIGARGHFDTDLRAEIQRLTSHLLGHTSSGYVASHEVVWEFPQTFLQSNLHSPKKIEVWIKSSDYDQLLARVKREYEAHEKHNPIYGYGSRLPATLNDNEIQKALNVAIELSGIDCLCAKTQNSGTILIFRRHHQNKYHAYPIDAGEFSKYGIKPTQLPVG